MLNSNYFRSSSVLEQGPTCLASTVPSFIYVCILFCVFMSMWTVSSAGVPSRNGFPSKYIFSMSNWSQVGWIYTSFIVAFVVYLAAFGDRFDEGLIGKPMAINKPSSSVHLFEKKNCITCASFCGSPFPTSSNKIYFEFFQESFEYGTRFHSHVAMVSHITFRRERIQ